MKWINFFIDRPVTATVINLMLIISGLLALKGLLVDEYPRIIVPRLNVETTYPNASTEVVEKEITGPIEERLALIEGLERISSESRAGHSSIHLQFSPQISMDKASMQVTEQLSRLSARLPKDVEAPRLNRGGGMRPILFLSVVSPTLSGAALTHFANTHVKSHFQGIEGLAEAKVWGPPYYMSVELNPLALHNQKISPREIIDVLKKNELLLQAGQSKSKEPISLNVVPQNALDYERMIIGKNGDAQVYLGDVATIRLSEDYRDEKFRVDGQNAVLIGLTKATDGNSLEITDTVRAMLPAVNQELKGMAEVKIESDKSVFIRESLSTIYKTIAEACVLVLLIIFLFLRHVRATLIPLVTIPISLCATFLALKLFGLSINTITLLAMVLAVGLVVDDAIVVLENIFRYREQGLDALSAARKGGAEIGFAIIAMTCTLMSVFLPLVFVSDITGTLLKEFAITLAASVFFSGIVALTLSPLMCAHLLKKPPKENSFGLAIERALDKIERSYVALLQKLFIYRRLMYGMLLGLIALGGFIYYRLDANLVPKEDRGLIGASIPQIPGFDSDAMDPLVDQIEQMFLNRPEVYKTVTSIEENSNHVIALLKPWQERHKHAEVVVEELRQQLDTLPFTVHPWSDNLGLEALNESGNDNASVVVTLRSTKSYEELEKLATNLATRMQNDSIVKDAHSDLNMNQKSLAITIKREALAALGIEEKNISIDVQAFGDRIRASDFKLDGQRYPVYLSSAHAIDDLALLYVKTKANNQVPLATVADVHTKVEAPTLKHLNQMRAASVFANLDKTMSLSDARTYLDAITKELVPKEVVVTYEGALGMQEKSSKTFLLLFIAGLIFIFAIMAIQFEAIIDPLIILFTVPFACVGGILLVWAIGDGTNLFTQVGMLTLIGLITKHGILLTEFVIQARQQGALLKDAVFQAAHLRFRPIVMTTAAMVLGAIPLIVSSGAGSESRAAIGIVIVGGMVFGTLLTLFVLPAIIFSVHSMREHYTLMKSKRNV